MGKEEEARGGGRDISRGFRPRLTRTFPQNVSLLRVDRKKDGVLIGSRCAGEGHPSKRQMAENPGHLVNYFSPRSSNERIQVTRNAYT